MDPSDLDPAQEQALALLVEATRRLPREARRPFYGARSATSHNLILIHPEVPEGHPGIYPGDLDELVSRGLVRRSMPGGRTWTFEVTARGFRHYEELARRQGGAEKAIEQQTRSYIDSSGFRSRHSGAFAKWSEAERLLWGSDSDQSLTVVGHDCREAMQLFATSLLERYPSPDAPADPARTKSRVAAVVQGLASSSSSSRDLAVHLLSYWSAVVESVQRQEHGAQKEGRHLLWEDARRVVFHTLFAMTELDRLAQ